MMTKHSGLSSQLSANRINNGLATRFGSAEKLLTAYNPSRLLAFTEDVERCYFGNAPTFAEIDGEFGKVTSVTWWVVQLSEINKTSGAQRKMDEAQIEFAAKALARKTYFLKVTEAMLFLWRFRTQEYGKFYGSVDVAVILESLKQFLQERSFAYERHQYMEDARRREEDLLNAMTHEEARQTEEYRKAIEELEKAENK